MSRTSRTALGRRAKTTATKKLTREVILRGWLEIGFSKAEADEMLAERPSTREECRGQPRPCPFVGCRHHLYLDVNPKTGSIKVNFPDLEPWELQHSCVLDVAEAGAITLDEVGLITNLTRERVRQLEVIGLLKLKRSAPEHGIDNADMPRAEGFTEPEPGGAAYDLSRAIDVFVQRKAVR